jgi:hypothetical protein
MASRSTAAPNAAPNALPKTAVGSIARPLALIAATLTTGLIGGFFYAYACSVSLGLALLSDERYVAAMQAINATVRNGMFAFSFFGAVLSLLWRSRYTPRRTVRAASCWWRWPAYSTSGVASW